MRQDVTATSGASSSSDSRGPAMDIESRPSRKRVADVQTEGLEDTEQMDANECTASLPQAEGESSDGRKFIGNTTSLKSTASIWKTRLPDMNTWASMKVWTSRKVNEQGVQWNFTNVEMRSQAFKKIVAEKPMLACRSASVCQFEIEIDRELESHATERER